ncbi:hypothetical protein [Bacteroides thetaiotaomicron]|uniref:hypothetical protein n=1 Tax=Bacteroides thetaiotaomicron TaxID=818 RepID=UPI003567EE40
MKLIPDSNNIARIIEIPGVKKTTEYLFIGTGLALVVLGSVCYFITAIKSHGRIKEQNDVFANKQREIEIASLCKMQKNEQLHIHRMQEGRKRMTTGTNWQNIKSDNCIKRNRGSPAVITDLRYSWRIFQKTTGGSHLSKKVRVVIVTDNRIDKIRNLLEGINYEI